MQCSEAGVIGGSSLEDVVRGYASALDDDLAVRLDTCLTVTMDLRSREVLGGLLARQATLAKTVATTPVLWTDHSADLFLRAMVEVHITVAWLLAGGPERYRQYIVAGINQAADDLRCREAVIGDRVPSTHESLMLAGQREWVAQQRASVGGFGCDQQALPPLRAMADAAGCREFFDTVYSPSAACAQSMWHHVEHYNLSTSERAVADQPRRGLSPEPEADLGYLLLAARYWTMTAQRFDDHVGSAGLLRSGHTRLRTAFTNGRRL